MLSALEQHLEAGKVLEPFSSSASRVAEAQALKHISTAASLPSSPAADELQDSIAHVSAPTYNTCMSTYTVRHVYQHIFDDSFGCVWMRDL